MIVERCKILIVGGGPAGLATALTLAHLAPHLAAETIILEAKQHPRHKLCGGGVTFHGDQQLRRLNISLTIPSFIVDRLEFRLGRQTFFIEHPDVMRVYDRAEFDSVLANAVQERGMMLRTNEPLIDLQTREDGVHLTTPHGRYHAQVVVAADGASSMVRRKLRMFTTLGVARLLRSLTPADTQQDAAWRNRTAVFDFSCVQEGIQGYMWDFPCYIDGQPRINRGMLDSRIDPSPVSEREHGQFKRAFAKGLAARSVDPDAVLWEGHPVRWYNAGAEFARDRVLLAGDAAGVDPLFAEGISYAMEYGEVVAAAIVDAFSRKDFSFASYAARLRQHELGRLLRRRVIVARSFYRYRMPLFWKVFWHLAQVASPGLQRRFGAFMALLPPETNGGFP